jgi:hypothetical protein
MKLSDQIRKKIAILTPHRMLLNDIGNLVQRSIQGLGRLGKNPDKEKFDEIAESTIKRHQYLKRAGNAGQFYGDEKPHNISGQLLDSIQYEINESEQTVRVAPKGDRTPYRNLKGKPIIGGYTDNYELAKELHKTRPFMYLSFEVKRRIIVLVRNTLRRYLKK